MKLIPDILHVYCQKQSTITVDGDQTIKIDVNPAYVAASDNPGTNKTGKAWHDVGNGKLVVDPVTNSYVKVNLFENPMYVIPNKIFTGVAIRELDFRGRGGRAYKVTVPIAEASSGCIYVDFREAELIDAIQNAGILPGGILQGEYTFGSCDGQMKLLRIGSKAHTETAAMDVKRSSKPIPISKMIIGNTYETPGGKAMTYLGPFIGQYSVTTTRWDLPKVPPEPDASGYRSYYNYKYPNEHVIADPERIHLFVTEGGCRAGDNYKYCSFSVIKTSAFTQDLGPDLKLANVVPSDAVEPAASWKSTRNYSQHKKPYRRLISVKPYGSNPEV
jgi:hypothetical protein